MLATWSTKTIANPRDFQDWLAQVELVANHFTKKQGTEPTHINVCDRKIATQLKEVYGDKYKFVVGGCLPSELRLGVPQNAAQASYDDLRDQLLPTKTKRVYPKGNANGVIVETQEPESVAKPVYDKHANCVTYNGIRVLDVYAEDVMKLSKDPAHLEYMMEIYDWVYEGETGA